MIYGGVSTSSLTSGLPLKIFIAKRFSATCIVLLNSLLDCCQQHITLKSCNGTTLSRKICNNEGLFDCMCNLSYFIFIVRHFCFVCFFLKIINYLKIGDMMSLQTLFKWKNSLICLNSGLQKLHNSGQHVVGVSAACENAHNQSNYGIYPYSTHIQCIKVSKNENLINYTFIVSCHDLVTISCKQLSNNLVHAI